MQIASKNSLDWTTILMYFALAIIGWVTVYSAGYSADSSSMFDYHYTYGKQFVWIAISAFLAIVIINVDIKFITNLAYVYYAISVILLLIVYFIARDINGAKAWIDLGFFRLQPSEFSKFCTALALAKFLSELHINIENKRHLAMAVAIIIVPFALILLQHDMGSALVFVSFVFLLHRLGLSNWVIIAGFYIMAVSVLTLIIQPIWMILTLIVIFSGILYSQKKKRNFNQILRFFSFLLIGTAIYTFSVDFFFNKLEKHQKDRINVMLGKGGNDWNVRQSRIALGSGQFLGKGFLNGTQSKGNFLPAKETDFIFCTIGEEWGFVGCFFVIALYVAFLWRLIFLAEKQKSKLSKVYGYGIVCIFMIHFIINIGMTVGVVPVIGIPLPAISYGGSSLLSFTIMLFIFLKFDSERSVY